MKTFIQQWNGKHTNRKFSLSLCVISKSEIKVRLLFSLVSLLQNHFTSRFDKEELSFDQKVLEKPHGISVKDFFSDKFVNNFFYCFTSLKIEKLENECFKNFASLGCTKSNCRQ